MRDGAHQRLDEDRLWLRRMLGQKFAAAGVSEPGLPGFELWSDTLCNALSIVLQASFPMFIVWGDDRTLIYNEAYAAILGARHPSAFGRPFFETWPELRPTTGPLIEAGFGGGLSFFEDREVLITAADARGVRSGSTEPARDDVIFRARPKSRPARRPSRWPHDEK